MGTLNIVLGILELFFVVALGWQNRQLRHALDVELDEAARAYWVNRAAKRLVPAGRRSDVAA